MIAKQKAVLLSPLLLLTLCGSAFGAAAPDSNTKVSVGDAAPGFSGKTTDDQTVSLADLKGKTVLVNFFATW